MTKPLLQTRIRHKLTTAFQPTLLDITDDSARHLGHAGHDPRGETHFIVRMVSTAFAGLSRVARHQMVYAVLAEEMKDRVHALGLDLKTPDEAR